MWLENLWKSVGSRWFNNFESMADTIFRVCCESLMIASSIKMFCKYFLFDCVDACVRMCADIAGNWRNWIKSPLAWAKASGTWQSNNLDASWCLKPQFPPRLPINIIYASLWVPSVSIVPWETLPGEKTRWRKPTWTFSFFPAKSREVFRKRTPIL